MRSTNRGYRMAKRGESVAQTRQRIVDAAVTLHGTLGPAATTIAAIAAEAGVTRLTVYRHFPDLDSMFAACSARWMSQQQPPRPDHWTLIHDPVERLAVALADVYRFYRDAQAMLALVVRDAAQIPTAQRNDNAAMNAQMCGVVMAGFRVRTGPRRRRIEAAVGHVMAFGTWESLCVEQGLDNDDAVDLAVTMVTAVVRERRR
ncbi:MAG: TetR/AcrR family transcriptional regulator [Mycobacteriales bacterium]